MIVYKRAAAAAAALGLLAKASLSLAACTVVL
jgi:hypothetical protein